MMRTRTRQLMFWMMLGSLALAQPRNPSPDDVQRIREALRSSQSERLARAADADLIPLETLPGLPPLTGRKDEQLAWLRLDNAMDALRARVACRNTELSTTSTRETVLLVKGSEWLALPAGPCQISLTIGRPGDGSLPLALSPLSVNLRPGRAYRLNFDSNAEHRLLPLLRRQSRIQ